MKLYDNEREEFRITRIRVSHNTTLLAGKGVLESILESAAYCRKYSTTVELWIGVLSALEWNYFFLFSARSYIIEKLK